MGENKQLEKELEIQKGIINNLEEGISLVRSDDLSIVFTNPSFDRMFGYNRNELIGKNVAILNAPTNVNPEERASQIKEILNKTGKWQGEICNIKKDNTIFWCKVIVTEFDHPEYGRCGVSHHTDLSELKLKEQIIKGNELRHQIAEQTTHLGSWEMEIASGKSIWSDEFYRICGYEPGSFEPTSEIGFSIIHPDDREMAKKAVETSIKTQSSYNIEKRIVRPDGTVRWVKSIGEVLLDDKQNPYKLVGSFLDISEIKLVKSELIENEKKYKTLFEKAPISYQSLNEEGCFIDINPSWLRTLGYKSEEVLGKCFKDFLHPDSKSHFVKNFPEFKKRGYIKDIEFKIKHRDGGFIDISFEGCIGYNADGSFNQTYCVFRDCTKRKQAEEKLIKSELKYHLLADYTYDWEYWIDPEGTYIYLSPSCETTTGYSQDEFYSDPDLMFKMIRPDYLDTVKKHYNDENNKLVPKHKMEFPIINKNSEERWIAHNCVPVFDKEGNYFGRRGNNRDITEQWMLKETLKASKITAERYLNIAAEIILSLDKQGNIVLLNESGHKLLGYKNGSLIGKNWFETFIHESVQPEIRAVFDKLKLGETENITHYENEVFASDGTRKIIRWQNSVLKNDKDEIIGTLSSGEDITSKKKAEELLLASETKNRAMVDAIPDLIFILNKEGIFLEYHLPKEQSLYASPESFIGKNIRDILPPSIAESYASIQKKALKTGNSQLFEYSLEYPDVHRHFEANIVAYYNENILMIVRDITERKKSEDRIIHLNLILRSVRDINHLITKEKERDALLRKACNILTKDKGYFNSWIALIDKDNRLYFATQSKVGKNFDQVKNDLGRGKLPKTIKKTLSQSEIVLINDTSLECKDCHLSLSYEGRSGIAARLEYNNKVYGIVSASIEKKYLVDQEMKGLFKEMTDDIAFALFRLELEEIQKKGEEKIKMLLEETTLNRDLLDKLINSTPDLIFAKDKDFRYIFVNKGYASVMQKSPDDFIGKDDIEIGFPKELIFGNPLKQIVGFRNDDIKVFNGEKVHNQYDPATFADGELHILDTSKIPLLDNEGNVYAVLGFSHDITNRKHIEKELKTALEKATESDRLKSAFLASMSHELRTPLNAIIGFSDIIDEELPVEDIIDYGKIINSSGNHLLSIVEDILDITLIESGAIKLKEKVENLNSLMHYVHDIIETERQMTARDSLDLKLIIPPGYSDLSINTDTVKLKQILINLLKNSLKFTHKGHVHYGYKIEKDQDKAVIKFYVEDTGIGIPENKQGIIFDLFRQSDDSLSKEYGGTGIGLSIAKKLSELLGGRIWLDSVEGVGTTFYFTIPFEENNIYDKTNENNAAVVRENVSKLIKKTVLIVEDDGPSYRFIKIVIEKSGINTIWAKNGIEAIKQFNENTVIDLVLMDINMPEMDGYEATREIRKIKSELPIIAQSAYATAGDREKSIAAGCNDFITKPIKKELLLEKIEKYLVK